MDASKIKVSREDMAVIKPEQLGLSPFGVLSSLFQQELEQRIRLETGAYAPLSLTLREEDEEPDAAPPVEVELSVDIHMDAPKAAPARKEPEKKSGVREAALETRILEKVRIKERELQKKQEVLHKLEIRLEEGRWTQPPTAGGQSQSVTAQPLTLATRAAAVPSAGGWTPQTLPAHPGYPAPKSQEDGQAAGGSILLPDVLRRRREQALQRQAQPQLEWLHQSELPPDTARQMMHAVHQAVEQTLALNHAKNPALSGWSRTEPPAGPARKPQAGPLSWQDAAEPSAPAQPAAGQAVPMAGPSAQDPALTHKARLSQEPHLPYNSQNAEKGAHPSRRPGPEPSSNSRDASEAGGMERRATSAKEQGQAWPAESTQAVQSPASQERESHKAMQVSELQGQDSSGPVQSLEPREQANGPDAVPQALPAESAQAPAPMQEPLIYRENEAETARLANHKAPAQATGEATHPAQTTRAQSSTQAKNNTNRLIQTNYAQSSVQAEKDTDRPAGRHPAVQAGQESRRVVEALEMQERESHKAMQVSELQGQESHGSVQAAEPQEQATGPDAVPQALPVESAQVPAPMQEPLIYRENEAETARPAERQTSAQAPSEIARPAQTIRARSSAPAENSTNRPIQTNYAHLSAQAENNTGRPDREKGQAAAAQMLPPAMARAAWAAEQLVYRAQEAAGQAPAQNPPSALPAQDRSVASSARPIALTLRRSAVQSGNPAARDIRLVHPVPAAGDGVPGQEQPPQLVLAGGGSPEPSRSDRPEQARGMEALPDWARELLEKGPLPKRPRPAQAGPRQFQWTSPQAMAAPGGTAQTVLPQGQAAQSAAPPQLSNAAQVPPSLIHPQKNEEEQSARQKAEREAEIRRTADRVYRIIEERLRRELRRSGR